MNTVKFAIAITALLAATGAAKAQNTAAQDSTGLPGDNFSLAGALDMFHKAANTEEFEKLINNPDNNVNNLDLNEDGEVDYIKVIDKQENNSHAIILQDIISETESQDVAVIELEKTGDNNAVVQIVGDEDIYGQQTIVEPLEQANATTATTTTARTTTATSAPATRTRVIVNVWAWPAVRYMYAPAYTVWVSPWGWRAHPVWWRPWHPVRWHAFYMGYAPYRPHYTVVRVHRAPYARRVYVPVRTTSVTVINRNRGTVTEYRSARPVHHPGHKVRTTRTTTTVHHGDGRTRTTTVHHGDSRTRTTTRVRKRD